MLKRTELLKLPETPQHKLPGTNDKATWITRFRILQIRTTAWPHNFLCCLQCIAVVGGWHDTSSNSTV